MLEEIANMRKKDDLPSPLTRMNANAFLRKKDRARGFVPLSDFSNVAYVKVGANSNDKVFALMKAAILLIEAALPIGAIDNTDKGPWNKETAHHWRLLVEGAQSPQTLTRCVILFEDQISDEWMEESLSHLRSCLPNRWKAVNEASASALAMRIILLDRSVKYDKVDKKRFAPKKKKK